MRLTDLDPRWLIKDGKRVGFIFISPTQRLRSDGTTNPVPWRQTCFVERTLFKEQCKVVWAAMSDLAPGDDMFGFWQPCKADCAWTVAGGIAAAAFTTISVTPSLDGSAGGFWHGFITNGEIR